MSAREMLDMCVHYIAQRHHMLTQEHVDMLDEVWGLYEEYPPLPPSPPPEAEVFREKHKKEMIWEEIAELPPLAEPYEDKSKFLPSGAHLLPQDYQDFLYDWNKEITDCMGGWKGWQRNNYRVLYPEYWNDWIAEEQEFIARYPAETRAFTEWLAAKTRRDHEAWKANEKAVQEAKAAADAKEKEAREKPRADWERIMGGISYTHQVETCACGTCGAARAFLNR